MRDQAGDNCQFGYRHCQNHGTRWLSCGSQAPPSHPLSKGADNWEAPRERGSLYPSVAERSNFSHSGAGLMVQMHVSFALTP